MSILKAVILGIIQGLTEFLPVSSSGHLVVIPWLFGWKEHTLSFDVMLHAGTLVAVLAYFWSDWRRILGGTISEARNGQLWKGKQSHLLGMILIASIPAGVAGVILEKTFEAKFRTAYLGIALMMIGMGLLLWIADAYGRKKQSEESVGIGSAIGIGCAQMLALFPGVSRSGATITAGLAAGLTRKGAARFSFLLSTPIIFGAALLNLMKMAMMLLKHKPLEDPISTLIVGFIVSAVTGYMAIAWMISWLQKKSMSPFIIYRFLFGLVVIAIYFVR